MIGRQHPPPAGSMSQTQDECPSCNCVWIPTGRLDTLTVWESLVSPLIRQPSVLCEEQAGRGTRAAPLGPLALVQSPQRCHGPCASRHGGAPPREARWPRSGRLLPPGLRSHHRAPRPLGDAASKEGRSPSWGPGCCHPGLLTGAFVQRDPVTSCHRPVTGSGVRRSP